MKQPLHEGLEPYLPAGSLTLVMQWLNGIPVIVKVSRGRRSKLGDYRPPQKDHFHRVSVNQELNPFEFLITLTHEIAHLLVWERYRKRIRPHGKAWKVQYAALLEELVGDHIFPDDLRPLVIDHIQNPNGTSKADDRLARGLHAHDPVRPGVFLEELPENAVFRLPDGRGFVKQQKLRKWYRCQNLESRRIYRISPIARVFPVQD